MIRDEKGFTIIELAVACAIMAILGAGCVMTIFQIAKSAEGSENHINIIRQVQNAGFWIGCDTQMAESVVVDNLDYPNFLILSWTEQDFSGGDSTYHSITYFFDNISNGVGDLKRNHWSGAGQDENVLIAKYIYYDPGDPDNTSKAVYLEPHLTLKLNAVLGNVSETREYTSICRPDFSY